ncbi:MAG: ATP-binding cassette domain-containing protein [Firmicutes bacterium]|nr:ATP-binding cassette domain-containing protein [Bacillota bacterium]
MKNDALLRFDNLVVEPAPGHRVCAAGAVAPNGVLVVRGPSGAGKSTLLRALARLVPWTSGRIWLKGSPAERYPATVWRRRVHYLAQRPVAFDGTVRDNVLFPFRLKVLAKEARPDEERLRAAMEAVGLKDPDQDARTLSGGELARVALLRAVLAEPWVLLLDEPTAALDAVSRQRVLEFLNRWLRASPDRGLVLVSHLPEDHRALGPAALVDLDGEGPGTTAGQEEVTPSWSPE